MFSTGCIVEEDACAGTHPKGFLRVLQQTADPLVVGKWEGQSVERLVFHVDADDAVSVGADQQLVFIGVVTHRHHHLLSDSFQSSAGPLSVLQPLYTTSVCTSPHSAMLVNLHVLHQERVQSVVDGTGSSQMHAIGGEYATSVSSHPVVLLAVDGHRRDAGRIVHVVEW